MKNKMIETSGDKHLGFANRAILIINIFLLIAGIFMFVSMFIGVIRIFNFTFTPWNVATLFNLKGAVNSDAFMNAYGATFICTIIAIALSVFTVLRLLVHMISGIKIFSNVVSLGNNAVEKAKKIEQRYKPMLTDGAFIMTMIALSMLTDASLTWVGIVDIILIILVYCAATFTNAFLLTTVTDASTPIIVSVKSAILLAVAMIFYLTVPDVVTESNGGISILFEVFDASGNTALSIICAVVFVSLSISLLIAWFKLAEMIIRTYPTCAHPYDTKMRGLATQFDAVTACAIVICVFECLVATEIGTMIANVVGLWLPVLFAGISGIIILYAQNDKLIDYEDKKSIKGLSRRRNKNS